MKNAMSGTKALPLSKMIHINLGTMSSLSLSKSVDRLTSRSQELQPEEDIRGKLRVIPSIPSDVISPLMSNCIVCMDEITRIPESCPSFLLYLLDVEIDKELEIVLNYDCWTGGFWKGPIVSNGFGVFDVGW